MCAGVCSHPTRGPKAMTFRTDSIKKKVVNTMLRFFRTSSYVPEAPSNCRHAQMKKEGGGVIEASLNNRWSININGSQSRTFIMRTMVFSAIRAMMLYSKGGDTTNCHMRYWKLSLFLGMWRVRGRALMAKSIQALCSRVEEE